MAQVIPPIVSQLPRNNPSPSANEQLSSPIVFGSIHLSILHGHPADFSPFRFRRCALSRGHPGPFAVYLCRLSLS